MTEEQAAPEAASPELEKLQAQVRRYKRNLRKAEAEGFLAGILAMLKPGDLVLDCGANVGKISTQMARTGAQVLAYEPDPYAFAQLSEACAGLENVTLHNAAVGASGGKIRLMRAQNFAENPAAASVKSTIIGGGRMIEESDGIEVDLIDFPALLRQLTADGREIALIKMDIEGAELDILEALEEQGLFERVRCLIVETHERKFKDLRPRYRELRARVMAGPYAQRVFLDWI
ncbi:FkbM family methyltransferase [Xinfangfangia sp. CPCC 101601]|uniref:FkbM family methyltransferase n=1 Tax=Pseudogemmobacter lacusdianii TaxID=3069608 RepID=A0ABU0VXX6_9RHOB|nr:FkbM family methyltransferase [Xinfangfangia sp. CPCC 101601]MDQ2066588.1 FkbM family methyltransferase [Xinfangfangia sp. CPCC 101601]